MLSAKRIREDLILICETYPNERIVFCMQLVIGKDRAALIDAGYKRDDALLPLIRTFTSLPVILLLTHGHADHVANTSCFDEVHIGREDAPMLGGKIPYIPLHDGERFELGGTALEAYALPGHSDGAFCFLCKENGYALTGDIVNRETWLCWDSCARPVAYAKRVAAFYELLKKSGITVLLEGHTAEPLSSDLCADMIKALEEIEAGSVLTDKAHHTEHGKIKNQHSYGKSTIIYDKESLQK